MIRPGGNSICSRLTWTAPNLERITYTPGFDGFPMFSPDGRQLAFGSNRNQGQPGETDVYLARWISSPAE